MKEINSLLKGPLPNTYVNLTDLKVGDIYQYDHQGSLSSAYQIIRKSDDIVLLWDKNNKPTWSRNADDIKTKYLGTQEVTEDQIEKCNTFAQEAKMVGFS